MIRVQSSEPLHANMNPTSCLFGSRSERILSSYWLAHFHLMKKSTKVHLYFGLHCGMMDFFTYEPQSKEQLICLPHFWSTVRQKRSRFENMQTVNRTSRWIRGLFAWSGSELWSLFKNSKPKLKNGKHIADDVLFQAYPMVPLSCRSNLTGRYLEVWIQKWLSPNLYIRKEEGQKCWICKKIQKDQRSRYLL